MKTLIFITKADTEECARALLFAAGKTGTGSAVVLSFGEHGWVTGLPAKQVIQIKDGGAVIAERYMDTAAKYVRELQPDVVLMASNDMGVELAARLGHRFCGCSASYVTDIRIKEETVCIRRRTFGFHMECDKQLRKLPCFIALDKACMPTLEGRGEPVVVPGAFVPPRVGFDSCVEQPQEEEIGLDACENLLCIGRGVGSEAAARKAEELGDALGFGVGASRPVVLNCWMPLKRLVGLSGTVVGAELLLTLGVSGCAAFVKGVEKSKCIIAVNSDPDASIFKHCDVGIVGDCNAVAGYLADNIKL